MPNTNKHRDDISHARLHEVLRYEPESGKFYWLVSPRIAIAVGTEAGTPHSEGYIVIKIDGIRYLAHRLAWFYENGQWPIGRLDHRDRTRDNNRSRNLREATNAQNSLNSKRADRDLPRGVHKHRRKFVAMTTDRSGGTKRNVVIGRFDTAEAAHQAWRQHMAARHGADFLPQEEAAK